MGQPVADPLCNNQDAVKFVHGFQSEATDMAKQVSVPVEFILGLAAEETQYGTGSIAIECNNYFSLHAPAPGQSGARPAKGDPKVLVAKFDSVHDSGASFIKKYGDSIKGASDANDFAKRLIKARFNSGSGADGGRADFVTYLVGIIRAVKVRMDCK